MCCVIWARWVNSARCERSPYTPLGDDALFGGWGIRERRRGERRRWIREKIVGGELAATV